MSSTPDDTILAEMVAIIGDKYVLSSAEVMAPYLTDWRGHYHGKARAVIQPASTEDVQKIIQLADRYCIAVVPQGGNTSLCGGATPDGDGGAIVLAMGRMNKIRRLDLFSQTITVEAGCILEDVQRAASDENLIFPLNFGARGTCQIGGNLSTNAGGMNVVRYGNARQLCLGIEVVTATGQVMDLLSPLKKDNTGYNLRDVFIGAEGTLGVITAAVLQLFPEPKSRVTAWAGVDGVNAAIEMLHRAQRASGGNVIAFELMPRSIVDNVREHFPHVVAPLDDVSKFSCLIEMASTAEADAIPQGADAMSRVDSRMALQGIMENLLAKGLEDGLVLDAVIAQNESQRQAIWAIRELTPASEMKAEPAYKSDISVPHEHMAEFYERASVMMRRIVPDIRIFGFGHIGDGNLHFNLAIPPAGHADFVALYPQFDDVLMGLLKEYGGSISAEHGIGQKKRDMLLECKDSVALDLMAALKAAFDPKGIMNPGKVIYSKDSKRK
jgi:FAD/FMN-containing dehydrogenase